MKIFQNLCLHIKMMCQRFYIIRTFTIIVFNLIREFISNRTFCMNVIREFIPNKTVVGITQEIVAIST